MTAQQPWAMRLADMYDYGDPFAHGNAWKVAVCKEIRHLHAENEELKQKITTTQPAAQGMEKDAERYRLRLETIRALYPSAPSDIELDTAIDAALAAQAKQDK